MRILMWLIITFLSPLGYAQLESTLEVFEGFAEVSLDSVSTFDQWETKTVFYPSGRKQDEVRVFVSSGCSSNEKCNIKYQHQVYYDDEQSTIALKEGKYLLINKDKASYNHYAWWYTNKEKLYRKVREKNSKLL